MFLRWLRYFLVPFTLIFYGIVSLRNLCYRKGWLTSKQYNFPIILVGNVLVGGTGKTPMVSYLVHLLKNQHQTATLSRGYGRKTKGYILANEYDTADTIGDEPLQIYQNHGKQTLVAVCENRNTGVQQLIPKCDVIVMDDAFQHRQIKAGLQIVLFPFESFFYPQYVLPTGNLREPFAAHNRADIIVVSKCPKNISEAQKTHIIKKIAPKFETKTFFTHIQYQQLKPVFSAAPLTIEACKNASIFLITGIANSQHLANYLQKHCAHFKHFAFGDHHSFTEKEWLNILKAHQECTHTQKVLICTEKDAQRLKNTEFENLLRNLPLYYLPIEINFLENGKNTFDKLIKNYVRTYSGNCKLYSTKDTTI